MCYALLYLNSVIIYDQGSIQHIIQYTLKRLLIEHSISTSKQCSQIDDLKTTFARRQHKKCFYTDVHSGVLPSLGGWVYRLFIWNSFILLFTKWNVSLCSRFIKSTEM